MFERKPSVAAQADFGVAEVERSGRSHNALYARNIDV
jgi:hypothetical protein